MSLRRASLVLAAVLVFTGVIVATTLIVLTTNLRRAASEIAVSVESLRIGEEITLGLIALRDATDPLAVTSASELLVQHLDEATHYASTPREREVIGELTTSIGAYIAARRVDATEDEIRAPFETAFEAARELVAINVAQGRAVQDLADRWDQLANVVGGAAILLLVITLAGLAYWLQRVTVRPTLRLVDAIERFAQGDRSTRAGEQGPSEFRTIAHQFNDMASTLERQQRDQLAFLASVAHDLRNPLAALKMATSMIAPDDPLPPEDRVRHLFAKIQRQIDRLDRMVFDFLDAARIESGNLDLRPEACDLRELAHAAIDLFEPTAPAHHLILDAGADPVICVCDPVRIEQVLNNLVSNAIKYSPRGGTVRITLLRRPSTVELAVTDEGIGIEPALMDHLFEPFRRGGASRELVSGVGLGLFVARRIVESHGGHLTVTSTPGVGSTFTVTLPDSS